MFSLSSADFSFEKWLLDQKKIFCPDFEAHVGSSPDDDSVTLRDVLVRERLDLDFTEALWMILRSMQTR